MKSQNESEIIWEEVYRWIESGRSRTAIAKELGLTPGQLRYRLKKHLEQQNSRASQSASENLGVDSFVTNGHTQFDDSWRRSFGENRLAVLVKEPKTIFAYWEVNLVRRKLICEHFGSEWKYLEFFLQVYDVTDIYFNGFNEHSKRLIQVHPFADNWYVHGLQQSRNYIVDFGTATKGGLFFTILRSNLAQMPGEQSEVKPQPGIQFYKSPVVFRNEGGRQTYVYESESNNEAHISQISHGGTVPYESEFDGYSVAAKRERDGR